MYHPLHGNNGKSKLALNELDESKMQPILAPLELQLLDFTKFKGTAPQGVLGGEDPIKEQSLLELMEGMKSSGRRLLGKGQL